VWLHGVLAGSDTPALLGMYAVTGLGVVGLAVSRYTTPSARSRVAELAAVGARELAADEMVAGERVALGRPPLNGGSR
jgi:hypothetical protein